MRRQTWWKSWSFRTSAGAVLCLTYMRGWKIWSTPKSEEHDARELEVMQ